MDMDIIHEIESVETTANLGQPIEDVIIEWIKVDTKGIDYKEPETM